ncbi:hypothetical protein BABINDRAFT_159734 [Babjeviella inositovora NRRL Y-12698]|uniref:Uncharacterized protein n=1 Tax=Babjeviella inositovora NRRL Y-12698 TaxID=984486 RepID=A0A1E3QWJ0_9ASCO|nr:uncharacterized protein BABINDRAFT_159734 [Babjeviella inositovora NRRL Y-12698]ODQ81442.1 hypothetical protein BABINDRAFT_159734 [Babjeviella inositovora NRRL Y-12698]
MISSSTWVPRGFASEFPEKYEMNDEEIERISELAKLQLEDARTDLQEAQEGEQKEFKDQIEIDDDLKEYNLEHYDDDVDSEGEQVTMFPGLSNTDAKFHQDEADGNDPFISLPNEQDMNEEKSELQVYPTDNMVLATRTEDDISYLDVYVYDDGAGAPEGSNEEEEDKFDADVAKGLVRESNLYVHHDLMLPAFPLCVEWVNFKPMGDNSATNVGNFAAIGTFDPQIEIWNLDCIEKAFPDVILGEPEANSMAGLKKKKKKSKKAQEHITTHHTDAILSLAHNKIHRSILASTSADATVKLWDLTTATAARSMNQIHQGKHVSSSQWHASEASILLTGGYDGCVALSDVRISSDAEMTKRWSVHAGEEVESIKWGTDSSTFYAGTDAGNVYCYDARKADKPVWTLQAHDAGISALEVNPFVPGLVVTSAMGEKAIKLWRVPTAANEGAIRPSMVLARDFGVGNVLTTSFAPDIEVAGNITIGGVTGQLKMWDMFSNRAVRGAFSAQLRDLQKRARDEAKASGRASRLARKYTDSYQETVMTVEDGGDDESEDEGEWDDEDEE